MDILEKIPGTIRKHSMIETGDRILAGLSGGPDSVCLTAILFKLKDNFNLSLHAVYIDHGLRPEESRNEDIFCRDLCKHMNIPFHSVSVDVKDYMKNRKSGVQDAARELRYKEFERLADEIKATKIALGHNADDQAETMIMRLLRGSGMKGLSGIPPVRGRIIRPLIETERGDIIEYLSKVKLSYVIDSSNLKTDYSRNWLRLRIMPELKKEYPSLVHTLCRTAEVLGEEERYLELNVSKALIRMISRKSEDTIELFLSPLVNLDKPILRRVLRRAFGEITDMKGLDFVHTEDTIRLLRKGRSGDAIDLPGGLRVIRRYSTLVITTGSSVSISSRPLKVPGRVQLEETGLILQADISETAPESYDGKNTAVLDHDRLMLPLQVRMRKDGDFFFPAGFGRRKKLQDFFVDEKVPRDIRDTVPVVTSGDDIIWIAGYRMDERYRAKVESKRFAVIKLKRS